jgi:DHA1 family multidrug resistance protein B-like MFS transporter
MELHRNVKIRLMVVVLNMGGQSLIIPFMAIYLAKYYGAALAGILFFITVFGSIVSSLCGGYYADRFGRKNIIVFGSVVQLLSALILSAGNFPGHVFPISAFLSMLLLNISAGIQFPALEAVVIDNTSDEERKKIYSIIYWLNNFALAVGTLFGAFLHEKHFFTLTLIMSAINFIMFLLLAVFLKETTAILPENKRNLTSPIKNIMSSYKLVFQNRIFLKYIVAGMLTLGLEKQLGKFVSVRLEEGFQPESFFGSSIDGVELFGILKTENSVLAVIFTLFIFGLIAKYKLSDHKQLNIGIVLFTCGFMVMAVSNSMWMLIGFMFVLSIGEILMSPVKNVLLAEIAEGNNRSKYMAANMLNMRGAALLGAIGLSVASVLSSWGMAILYGLMGAVSIYLFNVIYKHQHQANAEKDSMNRMVK